jgi:hypothetical protein
VSILFNSAPTYVDDFETANDFVNWENQDENKWKWIEYNESLGISEPLGKGLMYHEGNRIQSYSGYKVASNVWVNTIITY